jgi:hypothetical protein
MRPTMRGQGLPIVQLAVNFPDPTISVNIFMPIHLFHSAGIGRHYLYVCAGFHFCFLIAATIA